MATRADAALLCEMICALADYEKMSDECHVTEEKLARTLFAEKPAAEALIAYVDQQPAGFAVFFSTYSTFLAQRGLYLEDLFVKPDLRRAGVGAALFKRVAQIAVERNCGRFEWTALDWNEPAIQFYKKNGAEGMSDWTVFRLTGDALIAAGK